MCCSRFSDVVSLQGRAIQRRLCRRRSFFVISGYLITGQIVSDIECGQFTFANFYSRRIRRIVPAMLFTLACVFAAGVVFFPADALRLLSRDVIASLAALSNFNFWRDSHVYFAPAAVQLPLLHHWSLSVEEQFYAIWPAALILLAAISARLIPLAIVAASIVSLSLCQYWLRNDASAAFYLMPFRVFEFGLGAIVVYLDRLKRPPTAILNETAFVIGSTLIMAAIFLFDEKTTSFPGVAGLVPTVGAALVIFSGRTARLAYVLRFRPFVAIGLISYSLYLCHWPILVFATYLIGQPEFGTKVVLIAGSIGCASLMYLYVEKPFRRRSRTDRVALLRTAAAALVGIVLVAAPATMAYRSAGWPARVSLENRKLSQAQAFGFFPCPEATINGCHFGASKAGSEVIVLGDSHAQHWIAGLNELFHNAKIQGVAYTWGGCSMLPVSGLSMTPGCDVARKAFYRAIAASNSPVVVSAAWSAYPHDPTRIDLLKTGLERLFDELGSDNRRFLIIGAQTSAGCAIETFRLDLGPRSANPSPCSGAVAAEQKREHAPVNDMIRQFAASHPGRIEVLLPDDVLCVNERCTTMNGPLFLYRDNYHLTVAGSEFVARAASSLVGRFLGGAGPAD